MHCSGALVYRYVTLPIRVLSKCSRAPVVLVLFTTLMNCIRMHRWQAVCATLNMLVSAGKPADHALQEIDVLGFDMVSADAALDSVRSISAAAQAVRQAAEAAAIAHSQEEAHNETEALGGDMLELKGGASTTFVEPFLVASSLNLHLTHGEVDSQSKPSIVFTRGLEIEQQFTTAFAARQVMGLCGVLVLDAFMLLLATALFLAPLEKVSAVSVPQLCAVVNCSSSSRAVLMHSLVCTVVHHKTHQRLRWQCSCNTCCQWPLAVAARKCNSIAAYASSTAHTIVK
jgi:hypothetical protein